MPFEYDFEGDILTNNRRQEPKTYPSLAQYQPQVCMFPDQNWRCCKGPASAFYLQGSVRGLHRVRINTHLYLISESTEVIYHGCRFKFVELLMKAQENSYSYVRQINSFFGADSAMDAIFGNVLSSQHTKWSPFMTEQPLRDTAV